jgi:F0F1-type ATP synthase delta subunit
MSKRSLYLLAERYSKALYQNLTYLKVDPFQITGLLDDYLALASSHESFRSATTSSAFAKADRRDLIITVIEKLSSENKPSMTDEVLTVIKNFLSILLEADRLILLDLINEALKKHLKRAKRILSIRAKTSKPWNEHSKEDFKLEIQKKLSLNEQETFSGIDVEWLVNPKLLGGIVVEFRDYFYDGSILGKLNQLKDDLRSITF